ncbi:hypothetical protein WH47_01222 [Habropoda laboriosa]|uniref:Histone-lysine N-methyltransferase SETMAR n=1 Tax=Habropoda laboriosa TaxID=597456 RepID=A0A0L7QJX9_9HYME|nr:hypothetical protein WH47_01222 [Habropoda laboriosa]
MNFVNHVRRCVRAQEQLLQVDSNFLSLILSTDEATFTNSASVNLHNIRYTSIKNPQ